MTTIRLESFEDFAAIAQVMSDAHEREARFEAVIEASIPLYDPTTETEVKPGIRIVELIGDTESILAIDDESEIIAGGYVGSILYVYEQFRGRGIGRQLVIAAFVRRGRLESDYYTVGGLAAHESAYFEVLTKQGTPEDRVDFIELMHDPLKMTEIHGIGEYLD